MRIGAGEVVGELNDGAVGAAGVTAAATSTPATALIPTKAPRAPQVLRVVFTRIRYAVTLTRLSVASMSSLREARTFSER